MTLISFEKPKKVKSVKDWKETSFDGGPDGGYIPNMSDEDAKRWKGKHITGDNERIEIRKSFPMAQLVIIVRKYPPIPKPIIRTGTTFDYALYNEQRKKYNDQQNNIKISMNGPLWMSSFDWAELASVIAEAQLILKDI